MRRILGILLLALLLCGCTAPRQNETTAPPATTLRPEEPTEPVGIYEPFSDLEIQTGGAVRCFLPGDSCYGIRVIGKDLLAFYGGEHTTLIRYVGQQMYGVASAQLDCWIDPEDTSFQISGNGITYFNPGSREVVFLDHDLKEVRRLAMPGDMVGKPVLSGNRMQIFYCTADAVRVYDTTTGLDKLLKMITYDQQSVENVLLNDSVLCCSLTDALGQKYALFLSAQTGELLRQVPWGATVTSGAAGIYAKVPEGIQSLLLFGGEGDILQLLTPADPFALSWFQEVSHSVVTASVSEEGTVMDYYDLASGLRRASVALPGGIHPRDARVRPETGDVLIMAYDYMADAPVVLSWQMDATPVEDQTVYTGVRYTAENPDTEGLLSCGELAREIGQKHGLRILVGAEATENQPWDYTLEMEFQVDVIRRELEVLDQALSHFPEGFFRDVYGDTSICIVRSIRGSAESGSLASAQGIQFWDGENSFVVLAAGDTLAGAFYHEMFHVLDSKILSETRTYYYWHNLNPAGCSYFEDYTSYLEADVSEYLREEDRAFIDAYSMCYPKEDRARIMEYACQPGNAHYFQSPVMQSKLKTLCLGIREAFGLKNHPDSFLWEQYLSEPLTGK